MNVLSEVVAEQLCIGCGACAIACPAKHLQVIWNQRGELAAHRVPGRKCVTGCGKCLRVCPFGQYSPDEDALAEDAFASESTQRHPDMGLFRSVRACRVAESEVLERCASGGMGTWLVERLFEERRIDVALCVSMDDAPDADRLYRYTSVRSSADVRGAASSAYYPVSLADVEDCLGDRNLRVAVVGLPCMIKAVRRMESVVPALQGRTFYYIGLTCGQTKSRYFTDYFARTLYECDDLPTSVRYRVKPVSGDAGDFSFQYAWADGVTRTLRWSEGIGQAWSLRLFTPRACGYCDDTFSETADVSLMDAWRMPFRTDARGTSFAIARSDWAEEMLSGGTGLELNKLVDPADVAGSQAAVVRDKSAGIMVRTAIECADLRVPVKRARRLVSPTMLESVLWRAAELARRRASSSWMRHRSVSRLNGAILVPRTQSSVAKTMSQTVTLLRTLAGTVVRKLMQERSE